VNFNFFCSSLPLYSHSYVPQTSILQQRRNGQRIEVRYVYAINVEYEITGT